MTDSPAPEALAVGIKVGELIQGRYQIQRLLGTGGFAAVFQALDVELQREVALKVLNIESLNQPKSEIEIVLERFRREAQLAARLRHPCVVQIFDVGTLDQRANPYIVMEKLHGRDLDVEVQTGAMDPARVLPLFCDALEALGEAHELGIVHKDLKPANLFLADPDTKLESIKLVDFGIAHIGGAQSARLTTTGYMLGTPQYMAPEYVEAQTVSPALDVYQMGLVLVELLSGRTVLDDDNPWRCAMLHLSRDFALPAHLLDSPLGPVIERALAFTPEARYSNATAFAEALRQIDPASISPMVVHAPYRKIDGDSGDLLPAPGSTQATRQHHTDAAPTRRQGLSAQSREQPRPIAEVATKVDGRGNRTKMILLVAIILLLLLAASIAALVAVNKGSGDEPVAGLSDAPAVTTAPATTAQDDNAVANEPSAETAVAETPKDTIIPEAVPAAKPAAKPRETTTPEPIARPATEPARPKPRTQERVKEAVEERKGKGRGKGRGK